MADKQKCMIIGAVPVSQEFFSEFNLSEYFIICADGGYETALKCNIMPDLVVGDFDSSTVKPDANVKCLILPVEKDVTDTMFAAIKGVRAGFRNFILVGCLGGKRFDHSIANIEVLKYLNEHSCNGIIEDETTKVFLLRESRLSLTDMIGATVSVFPYSNKTCVVSYDGLLYPLSREALTFGSFDPMGVSNSVSEKNAAITVHSGTALVILYSE